jgi:ribonuclease HII
MTKSLPRAGDLLALERQCWGAGYQRVAGVDEVGRGAWAGPVVAAAVILPAGERDWPYRDSKQLSQARRQHLAELLARQALTWSAVAIPAAEVDRLGLLVATKAASLLALQLLDPLPQAVITDYLPLSVPWPLRCPAGADRSSASVAAASILAKVLRDAAMVDLAGLYPGYGFERHKGYGTASHRAALADCGPSPVHRRSVAPVRDLLGSGSWADLGQR